MFALELEIEELSPGIMVAMPIGGSVRLDRICRGCVLSILDWTFTFDFFVLDIAGFDLVLGMDWISYFRATINCYCC